MANRESTKDLIEKVVLPVKSKKIIPVHFDNIFHPISKPPKPLFGVNIDEFYKTTQKMLPEIEVKTLKIGERFSLQK